MWAQDNITLTGLVKDRKTKLPLEGVRVVVKGFNLVTATDSLGQFSLKLTTLDDTIQITFLFEGYKQSFRKITAKSPYLEVEIEEISLELQEVFITDNKSQSIYSSQMSVNTITAKEIKNIPAFFGEPDILKILQLKPGIQSSGEGSNGIFVRGGGADQNLVLLDEAPIYNANHLFGFFSVFNADIVRSVDIYKGGFGANYGGRLSSIIDIKLKDGNKKKFSASGGIGLISSRLTLEAPLQKNKSSLFVSARRTYAEIFTKALNRRNEGNSNYDPIPDYYFYDLNIRADYFINANNKVFVNFYHGRDLFQFGRRGFNFMLDWGNTALTTKWNHIFNKRLSMNNSLVYSSYDYKIQNKILDFGFVIQSKVNDVQYKSDFEYEINSRNRMFFGGAFINRDYTIGRLRGGSNDDSVSINAGTIKRANEYAIYLGTEHDIAARWRLTNGIRLSGTNNGNINYNRLEPRFSVRYIINENLSGKASFASMTQYIHLATNTGASLPTDIWYPTSKLVKPEKANQWATGISYLFFKQKYVLSYEFYYKTLTNQIDFKDGAQLLVNPNLEDEFVFGRGWAYGNELYLEKKKGKTTGWISYTLAWAWRQFDQINYGRRFRPKNDRRHDISVVIMHQLNRRISISATWVFGSGSLITLPVGKMVFQGIEGTSYQVVPDYRERNNYRMAPYHRLDLGMVYKFSHKSGESDLTFSIFNAYNRRNPYFVFFEDVRSPSNNDIIVGFKGSQVSLFPILPSITYNFKF